MYVQYVPHVQIKVAVLVCSMFEKIPGEPGRKYREDSVDRNMPTETKTLRWGRQGKETC